MATHDNTTNATDDADADADPSALGNPNITAGTTEQVFEDYGLEVAPLHLDGTDTGRRWVLRNGEFIAAVSDDYKLLPNERVADIADEVAADLGAVPFTQFTGDWYIPLDDHIIQDAEGRRVHCLYAWNDPVNIGTDTNPDNIQFGFAVHNSIDGSLGFHIGLFTFRHACQNMVLMGIGDEGMAFDDRDVVMHDLHKHTSGLEVDHEKVKHNVKQALLLPDIVAETYMDWRDQFITIDQIESLIDRFPKSDLPPWAQDIAESISDAKENQSLAGEPFTHERKRDIIEAQMPATESVWETYNDVTENVWHNDDTADNTKRRKMKSLHRVFPPAPGVK